MLDESVWLERLRFADAKARSVTEAGNVTPSGEKFIADLCERLVVRGDEAGPERFPALYNLSAAFVYRFLPIPGSCLRPEFVYVSFSLEQNSGQEPGTAAALLLAEWNMCWEAGHLRHELFDQDVPEKLGWLREHVDKNIFLLPRCSRHRYDSYAALFHLLPKKILDRYGLPALHAGLWPCYREDYRLDSLLDDSFEKRLENAFADLIWSRIDSGSGLAAFSRSEPLRLLAHNLDFWLPFAYEVAQQRLRNMPRVEVESKEQGRLLAKMRRSVPSGIGVERPRMGGYLWRGEQEAREAVTDLVEVADRGGRLRAIIDAVRSNRVQDDFSERWSFAKEDFERKLFRKRSRIKTTFVELTDTIPVHGPESEVLGNLICEDFMGLLSEKERRITVLVSSGYTRLGDVAARMGYANHSPVSKALARIRRKALQYLA